MEVHTPGPWRLERHGRCIEIKSNDCKIVADVETDTNDRMFFRPSIADANAKLIAAAPDLLAICLQAIEMNDIGKDLEPEVIEAWYNRLVDAVKKATE